MKTFLCLLLTLAVGSYGFSQNDNSAATQAKSNGARRRRVKKKKPLELDLAGVNLTGVNDWIIAASNESYLIKYSAKRLVHLSPDIIRVWTKTQAQGDNADKDKDLTLELNEYNCRTKATRNLKTVIYYAVDKPPLTRNSPTAKWDFVIPDTVGENALIEICKNKK